MVVYRPCMQRQKSTQIDSFFCIEMQIFLGGERDENATKGKGVKGWPNWGLG